jgi:hypothetical protein
MLCIFAGFILMEIGKSREESLHGNVRSRWRIAQKVVVVSCPKFRLLNLKVAKFLKLCSAEKQH